MYSSGGKRPNIRRFPRSTSLPAGRIQYRFDISSTATSNIASLDDVRHVGVQNLEYAVCNGEKSDREKCGVTQHRKIRKDSLQYNASKTVYQPGHGICKADRAEPTRNGFQRVDNGGC